MNIKAALIEKFAKWFIGNGVAFESIKRIVKALQSSTMSNEDKKATAMKNVKAIGYDLSGFLIDTGIQLALGYLKAQGK